MNVEELLELMEETLEAGTAVPFAASQARGRRGSYARYH